MTSLNIPVPKGVIDEAVAETVKDMGLVPKEQLKGVTLDINEFRKTYCGGKAQDWVRTFIFDEFPETNYDNGGWVVNPRGGKKTIIFAYQAAVWMEEHKYEIDWHGKVL
ncbi:DUF771 domain-containing protein [Limosilactobacillus antri]|uniref:DUF771 domain-containing protein n=1 Tax=Limosilactobacillus antri TaxID=227943 RepID=UPI003B830460